MTILNTASDGMFNVLIVLHRTLALRGPMDRTRLVDVCAAGQNGDMKRVPQTLLRWTQLGLFKVLDDHKLTLDRADKDPDTLPAICRRLLFDKLNNQNFWDSEGTIAADFTRALAFVLSQDIYANEFDTHTHVQELERHQVRDETRRILQNDVRWNGLRFWGDYLGFFWVDIRRWPDPTAAIREELPDVFGERNELSADEFLRRLSERLPVLDGGHYRLEVEETLNRSVAYRSERPDLLSTSLSRALWRLSRPEEPLLLKRRADAGTGRTLQEAEGREWETFTHVVYEQGD